MPLKCEHLYSPLGSIQDMRDPFNPAFAPSRCFLSFLHVCLYSRLAVFVIPHIFMGYWYFTLLSLLIIFPSWNIRIFRKLPWLTIFFCIPNYPCTVPCRQEILNKYLLINHLELKDENIVRECIFFTMNYKIAGLKICSDGIIMSFNSRDSLCQFTLHWVRKLTGFEREDLIRSHVGGAA